MSIEKKAEQQEGLGEATGGGGTRPPPRRGGAGGGKGL